VLVSPDVRAPIRRRTPVALHTCLVVSASARRAQLWVRAAHEENWTTIVCTTADDANRQSIRNRIDCEGWSSNSRPETAHCSRCVGNRMTRPAKFGRGNWECGCICPASTAKATSLCYVLKLETF
jgi:hypothetical protein